MSKKIFLSIICTTFLTQIPLSSSEMILGTEKITKDITVIFEGAPRDKIFSSPNNPHLSESETDVHIEALINWNEDIDIPSQVPGSFIPYLKVRAKITNQETDESKTIDLVPHINLIDGFHYARNIKLPGSVNDEYLITFTIKQDSDQLSYHKDWKDNYATPVIPEISFTYQDLNFFNVSQETRR